ncbi:MAG: peptidylprolyl isomerase [Aquamicrobium sp.]|uniref:peptidylprolyl isomerase n=1 Tax=Aquamicrobium sp. TaxID=1872579 RepID=UPI00349E9253|nr:peptidylprolyl isomerase [Aquamicrobium sp.]
MRLVRLASSIIPAAILAAGVLAGSAALAAEPENTLILKLKDGDVVIALKPEVAPKHVEQIKALVRGGEYDNVAFHRVIDGFMAQTGDVQYGDLEDGFDARRVGTGGSSLGDLPAEFSREKFVRGAVGMARSQSPDSANSQFFIMFSPAPHLEGQYTVVGVVESGMDAVDRIKRGDQRQNGVVAEPDRIVSARIAADN